MKSKRSKTDADIKRTVTPVCSKRMEKRKHANCSTPYCTNARKKEDAPTEADNPSDPANLWSPETLNSLHDCLQQSAKNMDIEQEKKCNVLHVDLSNVVQRF